MTARMEERLKWSAYSFLPFFLVLWVLILDGTKQDSSLQETDEQPAGVASTLADATRKLTRRHTSWIRADGVDPNVVRLAPRLVTVV